MQVTNRKYINAISTNVNQTMSSLEIAKLTGKNHADVMRDIRENIAQISDIEVKADLLYLTNQGVIVNNDSVTKRASSYSLPKRICDLVVS